MQEKHRVYSRCSRENRPSWSQGSGAGEPEARIRPAPGKTGPRGGGGRGALAGAVVLNHQVFDAVHSRMEGEVPAAGAGCAPSAERVRSRRARQRPLEPTPPPRPPPRRAPGEPPPLRLKWKDTCSTLQRRILH